MSMLAAPRRKQKWTLNPRGKEWSEDSTKFGQKMLEKMGWSSGKGLGANEQGMVEHVRVKVKNDQIGIGYAKDKDNQWTEHQDDFNSFLQSLQKEQFTKTSEDEEDKNEKVLSGLSLEEASKSSQKRVHYKKFTRGKDVNKYSTKDLANIFGKKELDEKPKKVEEEDTTVYDPIGTTDMTAGVVTIKGGNINDYFGKKLGTCELSKVSRDRQNSESESDNRAGFGFSQKSQSKFYLNDDGDNNNDENDYDFSKNNKYKSLGFVKSSEIKSKNKKLNNFNYVFDNPCLDLDILDDSVTKHKKLGASDLESCKTITPKKRKSEAMDVDPSSTPKYKKKKKEFIYHDKNIYLECPDSVTVKEEHVYENKGLDLEYPDNSTGKQEYVYDNKGLDLEYKEDLTTKTDDGISTKCKKNKKSKKLPNQYENLGLNAKDTPDSYVKNERIEDSFLNAENFEGTHDETPKKSKERKKSKNIEVFNGIENPALDLNFPDKPSPKKDKRKKNFENLSKGIVNAGLDLECSDKSMSKKSKNKVNETLNIGIENPALDLDLSDASTPKNSNRKKDKVLSAEIENLGLNIENPSISTPKKPKKKKIKSENVDNGLENPALDLNYSAKKAHNATDYEVPRLSGVENNALNLSDEDSHRKRVTFNNEIEYSTDSVTKKKKKLDKYEVVNEKVKKKKVKTKRSVEEPVSFVNEALEDIEVLNVEEADNEINQEKINNSKKKRKRRISVLETIEEAPEERSNDDIIILNEVENKDVEIVGEYPCEEVQEIKREKSSKNKSKKKKKKEKDETGGLKEAEEIYQVTSEKETKKKKNKKEKDETGGLKETEEIYQVTSEKETKKKKNKKEKDETGGLKEVEEIYQVTSEKETKKKKNKKKENLDVNENTEVSRSDDSGKENVCIDIASQNSKCIEKKKKSSDKEVMSLAEFLNEENSQEEKQDPQSQKTELKIIADHTIKCGATDISGANNLSRSRKSTKEIIKSLFLKNPTLLFYGSNINEIKGYGSSFK